MKTIRELEYSPNVAARSLRSSKSGVLAFVVHDISNSVYREILEGAQHSAAQAGRALVLADASSSAGSSDGFLSLVNGGGLDGLIIQGGGKDADEIIARAAKRSMPMIALQSRLDTKAHLLRLPDFKAARLAAKHLFELGHRRIGCIATGKGLSFTNERLLGIKAIFPEISDEYIVYCEPDVEAGALESEKLLIGSSDITALICLNVLCGVGTLRTTRKLNIEVPKDLSIVAIHELAFAQDLAIPLTTVRTPLFELGRTAIELVISDELELKDETVINSPPELILRDSTTIPS